MCDFYCENCDCEYPEAEFNYSQMLCNDCYFEFIEKNDPYKEDEDV